MGIRKNAKFLTPAEREAFVKACVLMQAEIVNPGAVPAQQYSRWDQYVAIHWMIQSAFAPGAPAVNFGHGGNGAYSFLSWHRYALRRFELELQAKVPGVMVPYWDWTDPAPIMTDDFLGPNGTVNNEVRSGYFAADAPASGSNPTPKPLWWPAALTGWRLQAAFGGTAGPLRRNLQPTALLPSAADVQQCLAKADYPSFQNALESGAGLASGHQMHNALHGWVGGGVGQMGFPSVSPFDPLFYLHHCNIDRLWAMWQADGHASVYPSSGGKLQHHRLDLMYPWTGGTPGYGTNAGIQSAIPMPDYSALGAQRNVDTLDHRAAFGYSYDSLAIIGIGLDRSGSMLGMTPDPMTTGQPDVTKWEAATRGVAAFLQDCETVQASGTIYTIAGIETFRSLPANEFQALFAAPGFGLVKTGSSFSSAAFNSSVAGLSPGGGTPLGDAMLHARTALASAPFAGLPADEGRYVAMLTDGILTSGAPLSSIPAGSLAPTAIFAMGFGYDVDLAELQAIVTKGQTLTTQQVFHGETAGVIDKFYSNALAAAIGFTSVFDPVVELFAGEHTHLEFDATSADDAFLITAQGMDFDDDSWTFALHAPDGSVVHGDGASHAHGGGGCGAHCCRPPRATVRRARGRLTVFLDRDNADSGCWVGRWRLLVAYRARQLDAMVMFSIDSLLAPSGAGTLRGPKHARLLVAPPQRLAQRNVMHRSAHAFDTLPPGTNRNGEAACDIAVNVYARTRLRHVLVPERSGVRAGEGISVQVQTQVLQGRATPYRALARLVSPQTDVAALVEQLNRKGIAADTLARGRRTPRFDAALALAAAEREQPRLADRQDLPMRVAQHEHGPMHVHIEKTDVAGPHHLSVWIEGDYCPDHDGAEPASHDGGHGHAATPDAGACGPGCQRERFSRLLTTLIPVSAKPPRRDSEA